MSAPLPVSAEIASLISDMEDDLRTAIDLAVMMRTVGEQGALSVGLEKDQCGGLTRLAYIQADRLAGLKMAWERIFEATRTGPSPPERKTSLST